MMAKLRGIHLYLGCFFSPLLLFFSISGAWQTFMLHLGTKDGAYRPPSWIASLSEVHLRQRFSTEHIQSSSSESFRYLILLMAISFAVTVGIGIVLAFRFSRRKWLVGICLASGVLLPVFLLFVARGFR